MPKIIRLSMSLLIMSACAGAVVASQSQRPLPLDRDATLEADLRFEASVDQAITPAKVIRWMMGLRGHAISSAPSPVQFQPIVNTKDGQTQVVAAFAYKF